MALKTDVGRQVIRVLNVLIIIITISLISFNYVYIDNYPTTITSAYSKPHTLRPLVSNSLNLSTPQTTHNHLIINFKEKSMLWCATTPLTSGIGNRLGQYWLDRGLAFWFDMSFRFKSSCHCIKNVYYFCIASHSKHRPTFWTQFLPQSSNITFKSLLTSNTSPSKYAKYINFSYHVYNYFRNESIEVSNRRIKMMLSVYNNLYIKIVQYDMEYAFLTYFKQRYRNTQILEEYEYIKGIQMNNSIMIHFRCGDILTGASAQSYGFASLAYYKDAIRKWNLSANTTNGTMKIYIIINLNKQNARERDKNNIDLCGKLINLLKPSFEELFKDIGTVEIAGNGTINTDSYLLSHAKYVLCPGSSFCELVTIGNRNNVIVRINDNWRNTVVYDEFWPSNIKILEWNKHHLHITKNRSMRWTIEEIADWIVTH